MSNADKTKRANLIGRALQIAKSMGGEVQERSHGGKTFPANPKYMAPRPKDMQPPLGEKPGFDLLGAGKAEGGEVSFKDMLELNPRGWGMAPPEPVWKRDSSGYEGEIALPAERPKDALAPVAEDPVFQMMTPIPGMKAIGAGLGLAAKYAKNPAVAGGIAGGLGFGANTAESGPEDISPEAEIKRLVAEKEKLVATRDEATKQFLTTSGARQAELEGKGKGKGKGVGPLSNALGETAKGVEAQAARYNTEIDKIDKRIEHLQYTMTDAYKQEQNLIKENIAARKPWYEKTGIPGFETAATWGPPVAAAILMRAKMNKITEEGMALVKAAQEARMAGNVGAQAQALAALDAWKSAAPKEAVMALTKTVLLPGAVRTTGMAGDATFGANVKDAEGNILPGGAAEQAKHHLGRMAGSEGWQGAAEEWLPPMLQGFEAAGLGALTARGPKKGSVEGELSYLRGVTNPDASPLQKMLGRDGHRSMSPDQIALEIAKRRSGVQSAQRGLDGLPLDTPQGPIPLWSKAMRGESTNPALPPPSGSGPSGTTASLPAPPTMSSQTAPAAGPSLPEAAPNLSAPASGTPAAKKGKTASRLLKNFKEEGVKKWKEPSGRKTHKDGRGYYTSKPGAAGTTGKAAPQTTEAGASPEKGTSAEDYFSDPDKLTSGMATGGGVGSRLLGMARRYARGGSVGPLVGNTGGRTDALETSVEAGSHIIPADVVSHHGEGNTLAGLERMKQIFGDEPMGRSAGGEVPVLLSDGEYVVTPRGVAAKGGHEAIDQFILKSRADHIKTLQNLPPPAKG